MDKDEGILDESRKYFDIFSEYTRTRSHECRSMSAKTYEALSIIE